MSEPRITPGTHAHRPAPRPTGAGPVDPLVATSHAIQANSAPPHRGQAPGSEVTPADRVRLDAEDEPIELADEDPAPVNPGGTATGGKPAAGPGGSVAGVAAAKPGDSVSGRRIIAFGVGEQSRLQENFKRQPVRTGTGACRVKSFHGKYSDEGLRFLDNAINHWLDEHPEVEVKFVTPTVMTFEGKTREPALVLNVWY